MRLPSGKRAVVRHAAIAAALGLCGVAISEPAAAGAVGFERIQIPQPGGGTLPGAVWYPTSSTPALMHLMLTSQTVAEHGVIAGTHLGLIVLSHGALGTWQSNADTALALAQAGFVSAAISHADFNKQRVFQVQQRPGQLSTLIDFMTIVWSGHSLIDTQRIGAFGFSLGGFTVLVAAGGTPDARLIAPHCRAAPNDWACIAASQTGMDIARPQAAALPWRHDPRIRAVVVAAPALGFIFGKHGLGAVDMPVQLWQASADQVLPEPWNVQAVKQDLPSPPDFHLVAGADHSDFGTPCDPAITGLLCHDASNFDRARFHRTFDAAVVAFFEARLGRPDNHTSQHKSSPVVGGKP
jgi:predicted dienelactone hydrolase